MKSRVLKHAALVVAAVILGFPTGFIAAIVTSPFWGWFEGVTGIESLGHSGPANLVFDVMFTVCMLGFFAILEIIFRCGRRVEPTTR